MANEFYQYQSPVNPGTTIRSNKYNSDQEAIETGFGMVQTKIAQSLKFTAGFAGTQLPQVVTDSMIWVSPSLGASLYPMSTFRADIQSAADNAAAAQLSQNSAAESESNAAASKESAANSANAALSSENTATSKAAIATTKAAEASASASTATAKASTATAKAAEASASASTAAAKADTATTKAAEARASASAALTSEASALASKNSASTSETNALASKNNAAASATSASNSAAAAEQARDEAQQIAGGDSPNALKLGGELPSFFTDIPSRLGYTPVQQGTGAGQLANTIKIGWSGGNGLLLQVDDTNLGNNWPITSSNTTKFNGQLASYYATAEALSDAGVGTVSKDIDVINTPNVGGGFYRTPPSSAPDNIQSFWHTVFIDRTGAYQGAVIQIRDHPSNSIPSMYFRHRGPDGLWADAVEVQHSKNLATSAQIHSSLDYKAASAKAVKDFVDSRLSKPAVKHYGGVGNITVDFNQAIKHVVTRLGSGNGTITLAGTLKAGDELVINNVYEDSGVATITGKAMIARVDSGGGISETTHTFTGQGELTMYAYDGNSLVVTGVR